VVTAGPGIAAVIVGLLFSLPVTGQWAILVPAGILAAAGFMVSHKKFPEILLVVTTAPFIVAVGSVSFPGGAVVVCILACCLALTEEGSVLPRDLVWLCIPAVLIILGFCGVIDQSDHMLLPVLAAVIGALGITGILGIMEYRATRIYR
jgi:hypothetical protein